MRNLDDKMHFYADASKYDRTLGAFCVNGCVYRAKPNSKLCKRCAEEVNDD